jgi:hypothetical protein
MSKTRTPPSCSSLDKTCAPQERRQTWLQLNRVFSGPFVGRIAQAAVISLVLRSFSLPAAAS